MRVTGWSGSSGRWPRSRSSRWTRGPKVSASTWTSSSPPRACPGTCALSAWPRRARRLRGRLRPRAAALHLGLETSRPLRGALLHGPGGQVLVSTEKGHESQQLGMNDYFTRGSIDDFIQEPSYSLPLDKMTVVASRPVTYEARSWSESWPAAPTSTGSTRIMSGRAGLAPRARRYLVGSNHRLLTDLRRPGYPIPNTYVRSAATYAAVDRNEGGFATYDGYAGERVIGVYEWLPRSEGRAARGAGRSGGLERHPARTVDDRRRRPLGDGPRDPRRAPCSSTASCVRCRSSATRPGASPEASSTSMRRSRAETRSAGSRRRSTA